MKVKLNKVWRQKNRNTAGEFRTYESPALNENMSFLEMLDVVNENLRKRAKTRSRSTTIAAKASAARARW
jgi:succinate dehydrogenase / fumarate reductase iron-sulfur subunit